VDIHPLPFPHRCKWSRRPVTSWRPSGRRVHYINCYFKYYRMQCVDRHVWAWFSESKCTVQQKLTIYIDRHIHIIYIISYTLFIWTTHHSHFIQQNLKNFCKLYQAKLGAEKNRVNWFPKVNLAQSQKNRQNFCYTLILFQPASQFKARIVIRSMHKN
jgi:hypothetical protein